MKIKLTSIAIILFILVILPLSVVKAENSVSMQLTSNSKLVAGQVVEVSFSITSIDAGEGVDAIVGRLNYDDNIFEEVTEDDFYGQNRWNVQIYNPSTKLFTLSKSSKVNSNCDVLKIKLKVKEGVNKDSTEISLSDIVTSGGIITSGGTGDIEVEDVKVTIEAEQNQGGNQGDNNQGNQSGNQGNDNQGNQGENNQGSQGGTNQGENNQGTNNQGGNSQSGNTGNSSNSKVNGSQNSSKLPKTGVDKYMPICITIFVIISVVSYLKFIKFKKI